MTLPTTIPKRAPSFVQVSVGYTSVNTLQVYFIVMYNDIKLQTLEIIFCNCNK